MSDLTIAERVDRLLLTLPHEGCDADCEHPCPTMANALQDARECLEAQQAEIGRLTAYSAELHRQLEKIWYTPAGTKYSEDEAEAVNAILGPTDDAMPPDETRAAFWWRTHGPGRAPERQGVRP